MRPFRYLAFVLIACAIILLGSVALTIFGAFLSKDDAGMSLPLFMGLILALMILIPIVVLQKAVAHLRRPDRGTALDVALNSAVVLWMVVQGGLTALTSRDAALLPVQSIVGIVAAYLSYRLLLKPAACRAFPLNEKPA